MTRATRPPAVLLALALAGCGAATEQPENIASAVPDDYAAKVAALPPGQRDGVLLRAIRDAGRDCQQVAKSQGIDPISGAPAWAATCDNGSVWVVALNPGGIATVTSAADAAKSERR